MNQEKKESPDKYVPLSQQECDRIWFSCDGWSRKLREAHKLGWDAAMKAQHEATLPKL